MCFNLIFSRNLLSVHYSVILIQFLSEIMEEYDGFGQDPSAAFTKEKNDKTYKSTKCCSSKSCHDIRNKISNKDVSNSNNQKQLGLPINVMGKANGYKWLDDISETDRTNSASHPNEDSQIGKRTNDTSNCTSSECVRIPASQSIKYFYTPEYSFLGKQKSSGGHLTEDTQCFGTCNTIDNIIPISYDQFTSAFMKQYEFEKRIRRPPLRIPPRDHNHSGDNSTATKIQNATAHCNLQCESFSMENSTRDNQKQISSKYIHNLFDRKASINGHKKQNLSCKNCKIHCLCAGNSEPFVGHYGNQLLNGNESNCIYPGDYNLAVRKKKYMKNSTYELIGTDIKNIFYPLYKLDINASPALADPKDENRGAQIINYAAENLLKKTKNSIKSDRSKTSTLTQQLLNDLVILERSKCNVISAIDDGLNHMEESCSPKQLNTKFDKSVQSFNDFNSVRDMNSDDKFNYEIDTIHSDLISNIFKEYRGYHLENMKQEIKRIQYLDKLPEKWAKSEML